MAENLLMGNPNCDFEDKVLKSPPKHHKKSNLKTLRFNNLPGPPFSCEITIGESESWRTIHYIKSFNEISEVIDDEMALLSRKFKRLFNKNVKAKRYQSNKLNEINNLRFKCKKPDTWNDCPLLKKEKFKKKSRYITWEENDVSDTNDDGEESHVHHGFDKWGMGCEVDVDSFIDLNEDEKLS